MSSAPDPQVQALLGVLDDYGFSLAEETVASARQQFDIATDLAGTEAVSVGDVTDVTIPAEDHEIPARVYEPAGDGPHPVITFFHGGGWVLGSVETHDNFCRLLTDETDHLVISVDYRLAPEHPWPAPLEDAYTATRWVADSAERFDGDPGRVAVAGDSAGGALAATVSLLAREHGTLDLDKQLLFYPVTSYLAPTDSREENATGYFLTREGMEWLVGHYIDHEFDAHNPLAFPLRARDLSDLPPALVLTCGFDPLRDEGIRYADRLQEAGVPVEHTNYDAQIHGFLCMEGLVDQAYDGIDDIAAYLDGE